MGNFFYSGDGTFHFGAEQEFHWARWWFWGTDHPPDYILLLFIWEAHDVFAVRFMDALEFLT